MRISKNLNEDIANMEKRLLNIISMKFKDFEKKINQKSSYLLDLKKKNIVEKIISDSIN